MGKGGLSLVIHLVETSAFKQRRQWQPIPVLLPGKSHGWRSLVGCCLWGRIESDTTEQLHFHFSFFMHWRRKWQSTPVFLPGESQVGRSLVGCCLWGRTESDMTEAPQQQQTLYCNVTSVFPFYTVPSRSKLLNAVHTQGQKVPLLKREISTKYIWTSSARKICLFSHLFVFIPSFNKLCILVGTHGYLFCVLFYNLNLNYLFCCSNGSSFGLHKFFHLTLYPVDIPHPFAY